MLNTDNKNFKIMALSLSALIAGVESQKTTKSTKATKTTNTTNTTSSSIASCTSSSPQCCWVVRSWQLMNGVFTTGINSTDNSCCTLPMTGVTCDSTNTKITRIDWVQMGLSGLIPAEIGNLDSLTYL